jgi:hypothetical protein
MSMIFPGMDPFLEDPVLWPSVHNSLVVYLRDELQPLIMPRYVATITERVFVQGPSERDVYPDIWIKRERPPSTGAGGSAVAVADADIALIVDVPEEEIHEWSVSILDRHSDERVVTVIEVVSPTNKFAGAGRDSYVNKQREIRQSHTHSVEIDLLRYGPHVVAVPEWAPGNRGPYDYLVSINRARGSRSRYEYYARTVRQRLPAIRLPLAEGDDDVKLDLQAVLTRTYELGGYRIRLRYDRPCVPPLSPEDQAWADELIGKAQAATSQ